MFAVVVLTFELIYEYIGLPHANKSKPGENVEQLVRVRIR